MANRNSSYKRHMDYTKALRKRNIARKHYGFDYYDNLHQYSDNKIHCSCHLCARKTNHKHRTYGDYSPTKNWKKSDYLKIQKFLDELKEILEEYSI